MVLSVPVEPVYEFPGLKMVTKEEIEQEKAKVAILDEEVKKSRDNNDALKQKIATLFERLEKQEARTGEIAKEYELVDLEFLTLQAKLKEKLALQHRFDRTKADAKKVAEEAQAIAEAEAKEKEEQDIASLNELIKKQKAMIKKARFENEQLKGDNEELIAQINEKTKKLALTEIRVAQIGLTRTQSNPRVRKTSSTDVTNSSIPSIALQSNMSAYGSGPASSSSGSSATSTAASVIGKLTKKISSTKLTRSSGHKSSEEAESISESVPESARSGRIDNERVSGENELSARSGSGSLSGTGTGSATLPPATLKKKISGIFIGSSRNAPPTPSLPQTTTTTINESDQKGGIRGKAAKK
eukprot:c13404_g1_i1.p1 GENE.c13404_g1_i1~~c13404_g1_i1.p1  ORF type:complete len:403 (-),score=252.02 c13404_g1_i1:15-1085(-)